MSGDGQGKGGMAEAETPHSDGGANPAERVVELLALAQQHHGAGRVAEAEALYGQALMLAPGDVDALYGMGVLALQAGRHGAALALLGQAAAIDDRKLHVQINLGVALRAVGRLDEAVAAYRRAIALDPDHAGAHNNLGNALRDLDRMDEAAAAYQRTVELKPNVAEAYNNLGNTLRSLGRFDEAAAACRRAIELKPDFALAHSNLGAALQSRGRTAEAAACYRRAIELAPGLAMAHSNLGVLLKGAGRLDEAVASYRRAVELQPGFADAYNNFGNALSDMGRFDEAATAYARAVELKPGMAGADSNRLLCLLYDDRVPPDRLLAEHRLWDARHGGRPGAAPGAYANPRDPERRLRIGYVSADFRQHPVGYFLADVLAAHSAVETVCYSNSARADDMTERLRAAAGDWRSLVGVSDEAAAAMIRRDGVDILVDLSGHTAENRLPLFTRRPAPVQASWLGYPGTTGLSAIDYLLMDAVATPPGGERWCSEAVVRLPYGRFCYAAPDYAPAVADPAARGDGPVTFGSFNNLAKIGPEVVRLWAAVLAATPGSRLVLKWRSLGEASTRRRIAQAFEVEGVAPERLDLRGQTRHPQMLAEYGGIDIALDPFPFCGGLTSCEALWMGVPVVTLPGERPASRQTLGFLQTLGLDDLAARSPADYVRIAAALAADPQRRAALRRDLRPRMAASPLCDSHRFTPALEAAFRQMWRRWCAGEPAAGFDVAAAPAADRDAG